MRSYLFVALVSCRVAFGQQQPCTVEDDEYYYNLSPLQAKTDYEFKSNSGRAFKMNVCAPVVTETWKLGNPESVGAFYRGSHSDVSIGSVNTTLRIVDSSPLIMLTDGSSCGDSGTIRAATAVRFICDHSVFGVGQPRLIAQLPQDDDAACAFFVEWRTHIACPTAKPSGGGVVAVIAVVALSLFMLYITVGVIYRRFALGYRGFAQFPRTSLIPLSALPHSFGDLLDWLRDIRDHLRGGARDLWPRSNANARGPQASNWGRRSDGFAPLAREEQEAMFHDRPDAPDARFSLEDEADREGAQELVESGPPAPAKPSIPAQPPVPAKDAAPDAGPFRI